MRRYTNGKAILVRAGLLSWFIVILTVAVVNGQPPNIASPARRPVRPARPAAPTAPTAPAGMNYLKIVAYKNQKFIPGLKRQDFKVSVDGKPAEVLELREERLWLSVMLIVLLGSSGRCGFTDISELSGWFSNSLHQNLSPRDQLGVAITDPEGQILLNFGASSDEWGDVFGDEKRRNAPWNYGRIATLSEVNSKEYRAFRRLPNEKTGESPADNLFLIPEKILIAKNNYLHTALKNALQYLRQYRNSGSRPIILMANDIYNLVAFDDQDEKEISGLVGSEKPVVNWIGTPVECCHLTVSGELFHRSHRIDFFTDLPKKTGGEKISCDIFRPTRDNQKDLDKTLGRLFGDLRMAYSMRLAPGVLKPGQNVKIELTGKRSEGTEIIVID